MIRQLRILAMLAFAALMVTALVAASAQAASGRFEAGQYPAIVAAQSAGNVYANRNQTRTGSCGSEGLEASMSETSGGLILTPHWSNCTFWGYPATFKPNGCYFKWSANPVGNNVDLLCPTGKDLEYEWTECAYKIAPQTGIGAAAFTDEGAEAASKVMAEVSIVYPVSVTRGIPAVCGANGVSTLTYHGSFETRAFMNVAGQKGAQVGLRTGPGGVYLAGQESPEPALQPRIETEFGNESVSVVANQSTTAPLNLEFGRGVRTFTCGTTKFAGSVAGEARQLSLAPEDSNCTAKPGNLPATVTTGSCKFVQNVLNTTPYRAGLDIACSNLDTHDIEATVFEPTGSVLCRYRVGPQTGLAEVGLQNVGTGITRGVEMNFAIAALSYSVLEGSKIACGAGGTNSRLFGSMVLSVE